MNFTIEQIAKQVLDLPPEARAYLADCLVESLDPLDDDNFKKTWATEARRRRDEIRNGIVATIPGLNALAQVRKAVAK